MLQRPHFEEAVEHYELGHKRLVRKRAEKRTERGMQPPAVRYTERPRHGALQQGQVYNRWWQPMAGKQLEALADEIVAINAAEVWKRECIAAGNRSCIG